MQDKLGRSLPKGVSELARFLIANDSQLYEASLPMRNMETRSGTSNRGLTLDSADLNREFRIHSLKGPACERLRDLGFCEKMQLKKLSNGRNLICTVCGAKMAISRELAKQVIVESAF